MAVTLPILPPHEFPLALKVHMIDDVLATIFFILLVQLKTWPAFTLVKKELRFNSIRNSDNFQYFLLTAFVSE